MRRRDVVDIAKALGKRVDIIGPPGGERYLGFVLAARTVADAIEKIHPGFTEEEFRQRINRSIGEAKEVCAGHIHEGPTSKDCPKCKELNNAKS